MERRKKDGMRNNQIYFLTWGCPWPGFSGGALRSQGLLVEASKGFLIDIVVFTDEPMTDNQRNECLKYSRTLIEIPIRRRTTWNKVKIVIYAIVNRIPFHAATVALSLRKHPVREILAGTERVVFCAPSHASVVARDRSDASSWILGQYDAEVEFWKIKAKEQRSLSRRGASIINMMLSSHFYRKLYERVGCVISVCEEDSFLTRALSKRARVEVIENGVDCRYFVPNRRDIDRGVKKVLFTGTSTEKNMIALRYFMRDILPYVRAAVPDVEFVVAGDFKRRACLELMRFGEVNFTGRIEDIRPVYDDCDVFICPYQEEGYGSKLKISQALAMGICVVTTVTGARGFPLSDCVNALVADTDEEFISDIITALSNPELGDELGSNGRELALNHLDWGVLGSRLRSIITELQN